MDHGLVSSRDCWTTETLAQVRNPQGIVPGRMLHGQGITARPLGDQKSDAIKVATNRCICVKLPKHRSWP